VTHLPTRPLQRLRAAAPLGWAGLALWLWGTVALPALHAAQHAREAEEARGVARHRQRIQHLVDEVLGRAVPGQPTHSHDHGQPGAPHGKGSIEHLAAAFAVQAAFVPPSGLEALEATLVLPAPLQPALVTSWRPQHPRGPPWLLTADPRS